MKIVYGVTERDDKSYWTRIGIAFTNKDGSLNLKLDFFPTDILNTTIQVREQSEREADLPPPEKAPAKREKQSKHDDDIPF